MKRLYSSALLVASTLSCIPALGTAQGVLVVPRPRAVETGRPAAERLIARPEFATVPGTERADSISTFSERPARLRSGWSSLRAEEAAALWDSKKVTLLPGTTLSPGSDRSAIYSELAGVVSGGWRFALGTTLAVTTNNASTSGAATVQAADSADADTEFLRFVSGGGNLSLNGTRPVFLRNGGYFSDLFFVVPRVWANVPALSDAENVSNFGGEMAVEYQYQRYANPADGGLPAADAAPFMTLQIRGGLVHGTNDFYRGIGRADPRVFAYVAPTLSFIVDGKVKLGATYFFGPNDFRSHQNIRINLSLTPTRKDES